MYIYDYYLHLAKGIIDFVLEQLFCRLNVLNYLKTLSAEMDFLFFNAFLCYMSVYWKSRTS